MNPVSLLFLVGVFSSYSSCDANPLSRIVNGDVAADYQFPWHVSLHITVSNTALKTYCGGSIIAPIFILTAASCLRNAVTIQVDIGSTVFTSPFETQFTGQFLRHPDYNETIQLNNIAIIRLQTPVAYRTNVRAILLPRLSKSTQSFESADSYASGFGVSTAGGVYLSNELRFAEQTVISNEVCRESFNPLLIEASAMCAVGFNGTTQSICHGDLGGALVSHIDGSWVQIGVSSLINSSGCTGTVPAGFTRITPYFQWITYLTGIVFRP